MEKLPETITLTEWRPEKELPKFIETLPKIIRELVINIEKSYFNLATRVNWLISDKLTVEAHTSNDTLKSNESGSVHTNLGATGAIALILPTASKGIHFYFAVQAAQELRIDPGTKTIRDDCGQTADKYKTANAVGECIHIVADDDGDWEVISKHGTWAEET